MTLFKDVRGLSASSKKAQLAPWNFLAPFLLFFLGFLILPMLYAVYTSLFIHRMGIAYFVGLQNYITAFQDTAFWGSIVNVLGYAVLQGVIMLGLALLFALLLETKIAKWTPFFQLVYFLPYAVPGVFAAIMWGFLYSQPLDPLLQVLHMNPLGTGALLYSIVNIATWEWVGYNMTLYTASLTAVSTELYDAARIDGCNEWQLARHIKIPLLRPMIVMTAILSFIGSMQLFNEPFLLQALTPVSQTFTPNLDIFSTAFSLTNLPYAATLSVILAVVTILIAVIVMVSMRVYQKFASSGDVAMDEASAVSIGTHA